MKAALPLGGDDGFNFGNREGSYLVETYLGLPAPRVLLPWTANVVTFNHSNVFAATSSVGLVVYSSGYYSQDGWARLEPYQ